MPVRAAGILLYKRDPAGFKVLLIHPGGPFYVRKDEGIWSVPKGIIASGEDVQNAALREFYEETGHQISGELMLLPEVRYGSGKRLTVFACEGDFDLASFKSNEFEIEWPPKSGMIKSFPEADRAGWFNADEAAIKILPAQRILLDAIQERIRKL